jgi:predicted aminopeptidase
VTFPHFLEVDLPYNSKDNKARVHVGLMGYEVWIHHEKKEIELAATYLYELSARAFVRVYNEQSSQI